MTEMMKITVADDKSKAMVEFLPLSGASGTLELSADRLLKMVHGLGQVHAIMIAGVESPPLEGQQIQAIFNTRWL